MAYSQKRRFKMLWVILYFLLAFYFLNYPFETINSDFLSNFEQWIIFLGGILLTFGAFSLLRRNRLAY